MAIGETKREVRITWIGFTVIFGVIGSLLLYRERETFIYFYYASGCFALFAAIAPMALLPLYRVWVKFAGVLAWVNTRLLLAVVFYLVITPIGLLMRIIGKDPLDKRTDASLESYWAKRTPHDGDSSRYEKQY